MRNLTNYVKSLELEKNSPSISDDYICLYAADANGFWCSESGASVNCSRQWVQEWELFTVVRDAYTGYDLIRSKQTRQYVRVDKTTKKLYCDASSAIQEARFTIDRDNGTIRAYDNQYVKSNGKGDLTANSSIPQPFGLFPVFGVAIADEYRTMFAQPKDGKITMDSPNAVKFYMIIDGNNCYFETQNFEFICPVNATEPLIYKQTEIDKDQYKYSITSPAADSNFSTIFSKSYNNYIGREESGSEKFLRTGFDNNKGITTHFQLVPMS